MKLFALKSSLHQDADQHYNSNQSIKYLSVIRSAFNTSITYRSEVFLWFFLDLLPVVVIMFVWISVFRSTPELNGYSLQAVLQYYFLVMVINAISSHHFESHRVQQIREGQIDYYLTRPLGYLAHIGWSALGNKLFYAITSAVMAVIVLGLLQLWLPISFPHFTFSSFVQFSLLLVGAYLLEYYFGLLIVLAGFWFENAEGLEHFKWILITLFSGQMIPLAFMPDWMKQLTEFLPFKFISALPIGIAQQTLQVSWLDWVYLTLTLLGLASLTTTIWHFARYKYASAGG